VVPGTHSEVRIVGTVVVPLSPQRTIDRQPQRRHHSMDTMDHDSAFFESRNVTDCRAGGNAIPAQARFTSCVRPKPEDEELQQKRNEFGGLEKQLIERELQLVGLRRALAALESLYLQKVGDRYAELDDVEAQIAELLAQYAPGNLKAQKAAREARMRAEESQASVTGIAVMDSPRFSASPLLKSLYRAVAKQIHPDLAVDKIDGALRQRLMVEANRAYERGDETKLRAILEEYESNPDFISGEGTGAELVRVIRKIAQVKRRLTEIDGEASGMTRSDLFELKRRVDEGKEEGRDILEEMAYGVDLQVKERRAALRNMSEIRSK
jgi:hypothetical protein